MSDMNKGVGMRLSSTQKDILFILYAIEVGGKVEPVPGMKMLSMINSARQSCIHGTNFRTSCHTLVIFRRRLHQLTGRNARCAVGS